MSVDPNLQSTDEIASRAPETATGEGMSSTVQPARKSVFREYAEAIVVAMLLAFAIRVFVVQAFKIPSGSMIPTLLIGDHILVSKLAYGIQWPSDCKFQVTFPPVNCYASHAVIEFGKPQRGDIIVFRFPEDEEKDFIKRIVGIPGDTVQIKHKVVLVNGSPLDDKAYTDQTLTGLGLNPAAVQFCTSDPTTITTVQKQLNEMKATRFYGTPTLFIDEKAFVGPKPYRVYAIALKGLFFWLR